MITSKVPRRPEGIALRAAGLSRWVGLEAYPTGKTLRVDRATGWDASARSGCQWPLSVGSKARASSGCKCCWPVSVVPGSTSARAGRGLRPSTRHAPENRASASRSRPGPHSVASCVRLGVPAQIRVGRSRRRYGCARPRRSMATCSVHHRPHLRGCRDLRWSMAREWDWLRRRRGLHSK